MSGRPRCACCAGRTVSLGSRTVGYRDLGPDGVGAARDALVRRRACVGCGTADTFGGPDLVPGFRTTRSLFEAIGRQACTEAFASVAERHGVDRATVRNVWNAWKDGLGVFEAPVAVADVFDVDAGDRRIVVARDAATSRVAGIHSDASSPGLAQWIVRSEPRILVAGMTHLPFLTPLVGDRIRLVVDPSSIRDWFAKQAAKAFELSSASVDPAVEAVVLKSFVERTEDEDRRLRRLIRLGGPASDLVAELEATRGSFEKGTSGRPDPGGRPFGGRLGRHLANCREAIERARSAIDGMDAEARSAVAGRGGSRIATRIRGEDLGRLAARTRAARESASEDVAERRAPVWRDGMVLDAEEVGILDRTGGLAEPSLDGFLDPPEESIPRHVRRPGR